MKTLDFCWTLATMLCVMTSPAAGQCFEENDIATDLNFTDAGVMDGFNGFAIELFKSAIEVQNATKSYIFVSPMSMWTTLTIMYLGAQNQTQSELGKTLGFGKMNKLKVAKQLMEIRDRHFSGKRNEINGTIFMENNIYVQEGEPIHDCIMNVLHLDLDIMKVNVAADPSLKHIINGINTLVDHQTNGQIDELIPLEYIDPATRLLVINTASFYGYWQKQFRPIHTKPEKFFLSENRSIIIDMMHQNNSFRFANSSSLDCLIVELPYLNSEISMIVLLPNSKVEEMVENLNETILEDVLNQMEIGPISLALPKFQIEQAMEMKNALKELGLAQIFDPKSADLSGYSEKSGFALKGIRHLPFIECNERGTTELEEILQKPAAAIDNPLSFSVNRPFVFLLRHNALKKILFIGLTRDPMF